MNLPINNIIAYILFALALAALGRTVRLLISGEFDYAGGESWSTEERLVMRRSEHPGRFWILWFLHMTTVAVIVYFGCRSRGWV